MIDLKLINTLDGGELVQQGNDFATVSGVENAVYLALFGGTKWAGNFLTDKPYQSETEKTLNTVTLNSDGRLQIEQAVNKDLQFLNDIPGTTWTTTVSIIGPNSVRIGVTINGRQFDYLWNPTESVYEPPIVPPVLTTYFTVEYDTSVGGDVSFTMQAVADSIAYVSVIWGDGETSDFALAPGDTINPSHTYATSAAPRECKVYHDDNIILATIGSDPIDPVQVLDISGDLPANVADFAWLSDAPTPVFSSLDIERFAAAIEDINITTASVTGFSAPLFSTPTLYPNLAGIDLSGNALSDAVIDSIINNFANNAWDGVSAVDIRVDGQVGGGTYTAASLTSRNAIIAAGGSITP